MSRKGAPMIEELHWSFGLAFFLVGLLFTAGAGRNLVGSVPQSLAPFRGPVLAMEFARTPEQVADIFEAAGLEWQEKGKPHPTTPGEETIWSLGRAHLQWAIEADQKFIIPLYVFLFSAAAILIFWCAPQRLGLWAHVAGVVLCIALVGVAAGMDVRENEGTFDVLRRTAGMDRAQIVRADLGETLRLVSRSATIKFGLIFAALLVLAVPIAMRGGWGYALAALFAAAALFGLAALSPGLHRFLEPAFALMCFCLALSGAWMFWLPRAS